MIVMRLPCRRGVVWLGVNGNGYKLLGFAVWRGAKWYVRKRLPLARTVALVLAGGVSVAAAAGVIVKRAAG